MGDSLGCGRERAPTARRELRGLLEEAFARDVNRLRAFVSGLDVGILESIKDGALAFAVVVDDVINTLERHGHVDTALVALVRDHPTRIPEARRVAGLMGLEIDWGVIDVDPSRVARFLGEMNSSTRDVLDWDTTLPSRSRPGATIPRDEIETIRARLKQPESAVIALIGEGGSGKSALFATLGAGLRDDGVHVLGVRLDRLSREVVTPEQFQEYLGLSEPLLVAASTLAASGPLVVMIDQLDALCELMTDRVGRLDLILKIIAGLTQIERVHVVVACRPFEFQYDLRLRRLDPVPIPLTLPRWDQVEPHLADAGVDTEKLPAALRDELLRPQVLAMFLRLVADGSAPMELTTYHAMRRMSWDHHVRKSPDQKTRKAALYALANFMAAREQLTCPAAKMDEHIDVLHALESAGWVSFKKPAGAQIHFRHQSLFEFTLARAFIEVGDNLLATVLQHQGLWIRRRVWSVLSYLRDDDPAHYQREFEDLWAAPQLRRHLRYLMLDLLGQVRGIQDFERRRMREALQTPELRAFAWKAVGRGKAWFPELCDYEIPDQMKVYETSIRVFALLKGALVEHMGPIRELVRTHWTADAQLAILGARLLEGLPVVTDDMRTLVPILATTIGLRRHNYSIEALIIALHALDPELATAALERAFDADIDRSQSQPDQLRNILEARTTFNTLRKFIPEHSMMFLRAVMRPLIRALGELKDDLQGRSYYRYSLQWPDVGPERQYTLIENIASAVAALAKGRPREFHDFVRVHESSEFVAVQHLLLRGLGTDPRRHPCCLVRYLASDPHRLTIGALNGGSGTLEMLSTAVSRLPGRAQRALGELLRTWKPETMALDGARPEYRRHVQTELRKQRLAMLLVLDRAHLDAATCECIEREQRAFPDAPAATRRRARRVYASHVQSPMSSEQMRRADDEAIYRLFEELPDSVDWSHPRHSMEGGSIEASRELAKLAKADLPRGLRLARGFAAGTHERPVAMLLEALAEGGADGQQFLELFLECEAKGFKGQEYRNSAARALEIVAERKGQHGLPDEICARLLGWLSTVNNVDGEAEPEELDAPDDNAILYPHLGYSFTSPYGSFSVLTCLFAGLVYRKPPAWDCWLSVLAEHLERGDDAYVWECLANRHLVWVVWADKARAVEFLARLFDKYPQLLNRSGGLRLVDQLQPHVDPAMTWGWIQAVRQREDGWHAQAYGELLIRRVINLRGDPLATREIEGLLAAAPPHAPAIAAMRGGIAQAIAMLVRSEQLESSVFDWLLALAASEGKPITSALHTAVWALMDLDPSVEAEKLLLCLLAHPVHLQAEDVGNLIELMLSNVERCPAVVAKLCCELLDVTQGKISEHDEMLSLIVTLQSIRGFLDVGLDLFEHACGLEMFGIEALLDDTSEFSRGFERPARRRRRNED